MRRSKDEDRKIVSKFYEGLEKHKLTAASARNAARSNFRPTMPAIPAATTPPSGWSFPAGNAQDRHPPATLNADPWNAKIGPYCYGLVELEEGPMFNCTVFGLKKKQARMLRDKLPIPVHAIFAERDGFTTIFFEVDEVPQA